MAPFAGLALLAAPRLPAQSPAGAMGHAHPVPSVRAAIRHGDIRLDGRLDEAAWAAASPITVFRQTQPDEGAPATQRTEVRILYDATAIYVGARMYDSLGPRGVRTRVVRRDQQIDLDNGNFSQLTSDKLTIILDPFHDHLTRAVFEINPSGVKGDALGAGGSVLDPSWDPTWEAATRIDSAGWVAELRIPLSQLRFTPGDNPQTWGLQVIRTIDRLNERDAWAFARKTENTGPASYGHLTDLVIGHAAGDLEITPYVSGTTQGWAAYRGDPVNHLRQDQAAAGVDLSTTLGSSLRLDATINPDFGQVEVDPAIINLSASETFLPEKRPFFIAGSGAFDFGGFACNFCSRVNPMGLFYSRRIGRPPELADYYGNTYTFSDIPTATTILGASKLTGRTPSGYTVGVLDAVTNQESGAVAMSPDSARTTVPVEPLSNYLVARVKRDLGSGATVVGGMFTSVIRNSSNAVLNDSLHRHAEAAGADFKTTWNDQRYSLMGSAAISNVGGTPASILLTEMSSAHYFQRPDRSVVSDGLFRTRFDSASTSLQGYSGYLRLGKDNGAWLWEAETNVRSPGFEANDLAYMPHADFIWNLATIERQWTVPTTWYRRLFVLAGGQTQYNFEGDQTGRQGQTWMGIDLPNYWSIRAFFVEQPTFMDDQLTRGGPVEKHRGYRDAALYASTDSRKWLVFQGQLEALFGMDQYYQEMLPQLSVLIKPLPSVALTFGPSADIDHTGQQYDTAVAAAHYPLFSGTRYVFASINEATLSLDTRASIAFTPTLTLDVYAQPFFGSAHYYAFKQFDHPRQLPMSVYGIGVGSIARQENGNYCIDPAGSPGSDVPVCGTAAPTPGAFAITNPDFNTRSLRGNAVLRWEWHPGPRSISSGSRLGATTISTGASLRSRSVTAPAGSCGHRPRILCRSR